MTTTHFDYLIVGGGMVADTAARGIREIDADGSIGILSDDVDEPYTRPALSKKLWTDDEFTWDKVPLGTASDTGADIRLRTRATAIRPDAHEVDADGETFSYGKLLLATGGKPVPLPIDDRSNGERALSFRTAEDYRRLRSLAEDVDRIAVVGGGYIGSELAAALVQNGVDTVLIHTGAVLGDAVFPAALAERFEKLFRDAGVEIVAGSKVEGGSADADGVTLALENGDEVRADAVVSGLGIEVATDLAEKAGLAVDDGVHVDAQLRTSGDDVYAAGDVASYPDRLLGRRRVEHVDNANEQGKAAGATSPVPPSRTRTRRTTTPRSSASGTRPSERSTPRSRRWRTGSTPTAASSTTSTTTVSWACCSGTSKRPGMPPARCWRRPTP